MSDECIICQIADGKIPSKKVYEDEDTVAIMDINGANIGHCFVIPKKHYPILEQIPDFEIGKLFYIANAVSSAVFEVLKIQGTNIFVCNGVSAGQTVAHTIIHVIPRNEGDGINLQWQPKQLDEEEMSTVLLKLKDETSKIAGFQTSKSEKKQAAEEQEIIEDEESYLVRHLRKIP